MAKNALKKQSLTTHAVVTGLTGSGKTGLCVALFEEAALQNIPAIIIAPKGDLTNLVLHFPELAPQGFQPWIAADLAALDPSRQFSDTMRGHGIRLDNPPV